MSVLNIKAQDQILFVEKPVPIITSGNKNNDSIKVTFDETWDCENGKFYASFYIEKPEDTIIRELTSTEERCYQCLIPNGMLKKEGFFHLGVYCEAPDDKRKTSDVKTIRVQQGAITSGGTEDTEADNGFTGGNIDLTDYVKRDEMPEIDVDEVVEKVADTLNLYEPIPPSEWIDDTIVGNPEGTNEGYCYSPLISVKQNTFYTMSANIVAVYDDNNEEFIGALVTGDNPHRQLYVPWTCNAIRIVIKKADFGGTTDINTAIENFNSQFMLIEGENFPTEYFPYGSPAYRIKDNVQVPNGGTNTSGGDVVAPDMPKKLSDFENDVGFITEQYYKDNREFYDDIAQGEVFTLQTNMQFDENWTTVVKHDSYDFFSNLDRYYKLVDVEKYPFDWISPDYYVVDKLDLTYPNGVWANFVTDEETYILARPVNNTDGSFGFELKVGKTKDSSKQSAYFVLKNTIRDTNGDTVYDWKCISVRVENLPLPDMTGLTETDLNYVFYGNTRQLKKIDNKFIDIPTIAEKAVEIIDTALLELLG